MTQKINQVLNMYAFHYMHDGIKVELYSHNKLMKFRG